jgi:glycosyltransferase involved in cell wall biosynthesis
VRNTRRRAPAGSVPEVVVHDRTGIVVDALDELPEAVARADRIDRHACRLHVEAHFAAPRMVDDYVAAYRSLLEEVAGDSSGSSSRLLAAPRGLLTFSG